MKLTRLQTIIANRITDVLEPEGNKEIFNALLEEITAEPEANCEASLAKAEIELERAKETARQYEKITNWAYLFRNNTAEFLGYVPGDTLPDWEEFTKMVHDRLASKDLEGAKAKIEYLEAQIKRASSTIGTALGFYQSARYELGIDWEGKEPTYEEVFNKALKVLRDCQSTDKTIFELRRERDELRNDAKKYEDLLEKCLEVTVGNKYESLLEFVQNASELPLMREDRDQLLDRIKVLEKSEVEILAKVKDLEERLLTSHTVNDNLRSEIASEKTEAERYKNANIDLSAKVADLEKRLRAAKSLPPATKPAPTMPFSGAAKTSAPPLVGTTPPPRFIPHWNYQTSPEVMHEYVRLIAAGQSPYQAAVTAGVVESERDRARTNFKMAIDGAKARTGVDRDEFLAAQLKNWRERRDHGVAPARGKK